MQDVLWWFGFGPTVHKWIALLYSAPVAAVKLYGMVSEFKIVWGTRLGCPLSPGLFTLMIEPLAVSSRVQGIQVGVLEEENYVLCHDALSKGP